MRFGRGNGAGFRKGYRHFEFPVRGIENEIPNILDTLENFGRDAITILREQLRFEEALDQLVHDFKVKKDGDSYKIA